VWLQYLSYGILFFIVAKLNFERREIDLLIKIFLGVSVILCLIGIYFYLVGGYSRLTSTFYWPNPFAGYLLFSLPLGLFWFLESKKVFREKLLPVLILILLITSFILTASRGAFLSILIGLIIYFVVDFRRTKRELFVLFLLISLSFSLVFLLGLIKSENVIFLHSRASQESFLDTSSSIRLNYWKGTWEIFKDRPLTGSGLGTFGTIYPQYQKDPISAGKYAHNLYLEMLSEEGIFVLIIFIVFLTSIYWNSFRDLKEKNYALPLYIGTLAFMFHNGVDIDWHFPANTLTFWIFLGLFYNISQGKEVNKLLTKIFTFLSRFKRKYSLKKHNSIINLLIVSISILLIIKGIIFLYSSFNFNKGTEYQSRGNLILAENAYYQSIFLNPNPNYLRQYGIILYSKGINSQAKEREEFLDNALKISNKTIKIDSYNSLNYELRGKVYYAQSKFKEAEKEFYKSIQLSRFIPRFYINLASLLIEQRRMEEARDIIQKIISYYSEDVVKNRKMYILKDQQITSGIEKDISYLYYLLDLTY
jgi:tetratricopeptide (TPR) repeat protein